MDNHFRLSLKQIMLLISITAILAAFIGVLIFYLGQQSSNMLIGVNEPTPTASMPPLPKAMTATPRPKQSEIFIFTQEMLTEAAQSGSSEGVPISVDAVRISPDSVTIDGQIDYLGYIGSVSISGQPYVDIGRLRVHLTSLTLEGQPLPAILYPTVEEQINLAFDQIMSGYTVEDVLLEDGQMTVTVIPW